MSSSENIPKEKLDFLNNFRHFSSKQAEVRLDSVKFGKALSILYADRSPPLRHKESGRRFSPNF